VRHISKDSVRLNQDYTDVQKFLGETGPNKTLRVGTDQNGQKVLYAKTQSIRGRLLAKLDPETEKIKRSAVLGFIVSNAVNSGVDPYLLTAKLHKNDKSPKVKHVKSRLAPVVKIGGQKYVMGDRIAKSSSALISEAYDQDGILYAVKCFDSNEMPKEEFEKAKNEVELWKKAQGDGHPNILPFLGSAEVDGKLYIAMPYMPNGDGVDVVESLWKDKTILDDDRKLALLTLYGDMLRGLQHAHNNGVIHGDVKLDNLMINKNLEWQLIDWGVAKEKGGNRGETGKDDLTFKAPNQIKHDQAARKGNGWARVYVASAADDVWSAGASFVKYLTGRDAIPLKSQFNYERENELTGYKTSADKTYTRQRAATRATELDPFASFLDRAMESDPRKRAGIDELLKDPVFNNPEVGSPRIRKLIFAHCKNAPADVVGAPPQNQLAPVPDLI
jgi:serine/threonine protein kinase